MARILIVEDHPRLAKAVRMGLEDEGHVVEVQHDGQEGLFAATSGRFDLVVLDRMLPRFSGDDLCRRLREDGLSVPVLMLTARDDPADVVEGLDLGADDYVTKPFAFDEFLARVRALLRRSVGNAYRLGPLELDPASQQASWHGVDAALTRKEYAILELLARRRGRVVSKSQLAEAVWEDDAPADNAIEVHISSLRRKLDRRLIQTRRGLGYVLETP